MRNVVISAGLTTFYLFRCGGAAECSVSADGVQGRGKVEELLGRPHIFRGACRPIRFCSRRIHCGLKQGLLSVSR